MIRRALMRRGVYTGVYTTWHPTQGVYPPRPKFYAILNHPGSGMVRLELGIGRRSWWADWGRGAGQ